MRLRLRYRVRTLLITVALAALAFGLLILERRARQFGTVAAYHAREEQRCLDLADPVKAAHLVRAFYDPGPGEPRGPFPPDFEKVAEMAEQIIAPWRRRVAYHEAMYRKYQRAARRPWLSIPPDPPAPP